jgi:hypothetical protein
MRAERIGVLQHLTQSRSQLRGIAQPAISVRPEPSQQMGVSGGAWPDCVRENGIPQRRTRRRMALMPKQRLRRRTHRSHLRGRGPGIFRLSRVCPPPPSRIPPPAGQCRRARSAAGNEVDGSWAGDKTVVAQSRKLRERALVINYETRLLALDRWPTCDTAQIFCRLPDLLAMERAFYSDFRMALLRGTRRTPSCVGECHKEGYGDYVPMRGDLLEHDNSPGTPGPAIEPISVGIATSLP